MKESTQGKAHNGDKRSIRSRERIKEAFVSLHEKISYDGVTVSSLCKEAGVSRGTFYAHYKNVTDVLSEVLDDIMEHIDRFWPKHLDIEDEEPSEKCRRPFCVFVRENTKYQKILTDDAFSSLIVKKLLDRSFENTYKYLSKKTKLTRQQVRALISFQTSGCLTITKMGIREKASEWSCVKGCIDNFIKSGIDHILESGKDEKKEDSAGRKMNIFEQCVH